MRPRKRDPAFLQIAVLAAAGGLLAIGFAIGLPLWSYYHGKPITPAFSLFAGWGVAALMGAYGCVRTYFITDQGPGGPPRGGVRLTVVERRLERPAPAPVVVEDERRAA
jgi:hypothetical protein